MRTKFISSGVKNFLLLAGAVSLLCANKAALGDTIVFSEGWETPVISSAPIEIFPGAFIPTDTRLPEGWRTVSNASFSYIQPATSRFDEFLPITSPADGNQFLVLSGGTGSASGVLFSADTISADTTYTLTAAIGSVIGTQDNTEWSLELWADTNGDASGDILLGGTNGNVPGASNPSRGQWSLNSVSIDSNDTPEVVGSDLVVLLSNLSNSTSYFDNVTLSSATSVPEPNTGLILTLMGGMLAARRRRTEK